ncbi:MAG: VWA domain-containing protein [Gammaproteobacteria bacterium]|nr:VWA domain-containing protein [Gammaproteobacteria bacterium]
MAKPPSQRSSSRDIAQFLATSKAIAKVVEAQPRLLFAIDATASRQPTWDTACQLQHEMFRATQQTASPGAASSAQSSADASPHASLHSSLQQRALLSVQLCYFRGFHEFYASRWLQDSAALSRIMSSVRCEGGHTQIARLLRHAIAEHRKRPIRALVFIGDAMEENPDTLCDLAGQCGLLKLPLFVFQEGHDRTVERTFRAMSRLSAGAWARFDAGSAARLASLLGAVASYATGGRKALANNSSEGAKLLLQQLTD